MDKVTEFYTEASKLGTTGMKSNDNDMAALQNSAIIQRLMAMVLDLQARIKVLEGQTSVVK